MKIFNFLTDSALWASTTVFAPIAGQLIHGEQVGQSPNEIRQTLRRQFKISEALRLDDAQELEINRVIENANTVLSKHFSLRDTVVYIAGIDSSEDFANKHLGGVSGYAWPKAILLYFNPEKNWPRLLLRTLLHEYNHCQRYRFSDPYRSFLDWLIFEGLAESFECEMTQGESNFEKNRELAKQYIPIFRRFWNESPEDGYLWFFGDEARKIPVGLGYAVGCYLVENFRQASPSLTWSQLNEIPSHEFAARLTVI